MNDQKIAFIVCVNDEAEFSETLYYIDKLKIPEGFETDVIAVREASSMAEGYQAAMESSDAKYKIYLHQDVFLIYQDILKDMLEIFMADSGIGMIGVLGARVLPRNAYAISCWNTGKTFYNGSPMYYFGYEKKHTYTEVMAADGMFLATQYDIPWREDLFDGWDFYDLSQCVEFLRAGKKVVVPYQKQIWTYHDNKASNLSFYNKYRERYIAEYQDIYPFLKEREEESFAEREDFEKVKVQMRLELEKLISSGQIEEACKIFDSPDYHETEALKEVHLICQIYKLEQENAVKEQLHSAHALYAETFLRMKRLKHLLKRMEFGVLSSADEEELVNEYSIYASAIIMLAYVRCSKEVFEKLIKLYQKYDKTKAELFLRYQRFFCQKNRISSGIKILKEGHFIAGQKSLVFTEKLTDAFLKEVSRMQYDKENVVIFVKESLVEVTEIKHAAIWQGILPELICQEQDRLYLDYEQVIVYGKQLEEFVKLFYATDVPVTWYIEEEHLVGTAYTENIQCVEMV